LVTGFGRASLVSELLAVILVAGFKSATEYGLKYTVGEWREVICRTLVEVHEEGDKIDLIHDSTLGVVAVLHLSESKSSNMS
jgi:hypothetical protein